ncbi:MAG: hypothetical protein R3348_01920 [Xanthomonadales bacterium]|nr:hypothetical protein [Xanthomonadales bacterium]
MKREAQVCLWAGLLPIAAVNLAFAINVYQGFEACFPYIEGCASVSRGVRSGAGLWLFKASALPAAMLMWLSWHPRALQSMFEQPVRLKLISRFGRIGAVFFLVYAAWLGTEGDIYRWLRRYGVVFYFGLTGLAHLLLAARLHRYRMPDTAHRLYLVTVALAWASGVGSAFKRRLIEDEILLDRVENLLEWNFALLLSLCFVALAGVLHHHARLRGAASS